MKRIKLTGLALLAATTILVPSAFASTGLGLPLSKTSVAASQSGFAATVQLASNARELAEGEGLQAGHSGSGEHDDNDHGSMRPSHETSNDGDHSNGGDNDSGHSGGHNGDNGHSDGHDGDGGHSSGADSDGGHSDGHDGDGGHSGGHDSDGGHSGGDDSDGGHSGGDADGDGGDGEGEGEGDND